MAAPQTQDALAREWDSVASLKPRLVAHVRVNRHNYRGEDWYVLRDAASNHHHRLSADAHQVVEAMDGERTLSEIEAELRDSLGERAPTRTDLMRLVAQLHAAELLRSDVPIAFESLQDRSARSRRQSWQRRLMAPLAITIPLFNPTSVLERGLPWVRPLFSRAGLVTWMGVVLVSLVFAAQHAPELTLHAQDRALAPLNLVVLWLLFPVVKALHEFGHAFAARVWGGEVREMGITLLVLTPVPYVDASSSTAFRQKHRRMLVAAAGVMVELFVAALAFWVWLGVEAGAVRDAALDVMLIAAVSTLLFNANPLLRFDAYYVLADALEMPNLGPRASRYLAYLIHRYAFGMADATSPASAPGERKWLVLYGISASVYRVFLLFVIAVFLASRFFVLGVLLALWTLVARIVVPTLRQLYFVSFDPRLEGRRARAMGVAAGGLVFASVLLFALPMPSSTVAEGVVQLPERSRVSADADGFVTRVLAQDGSQVKRGDPLFETDDPLLRTRAGRLEWQIRELETRRVSQMLEDRVRFQALQGEIDVLHAELNELRDRVDKLVIRSPADGVFVSPVARHLPGRFVSRGETLAHVIGHEDGVTARVVVPQADAAVVRSRTRAVAARLAHRPGVTLEGHIERDVPSASHRLPSHALGTRGGGAVEVDVRDAEGMRTLEPHFELDVALPESGRPYFAGSRVYVLFEHPAEPLGPRWWRRVRQLLLSQLQV